MPLPIDDVANLEMVTKINGQITQSGNTSEMFFNVSRCVSYLSKIVPLYAGDLILTGTPKGWDSNFLEIGDEVEHEIEKVGKLKFTIGS